MTADAVRRIAAVALVSYLVFLAWVLLWPNAGPASSSVDSVLRLLWGAGFSHETVTGPRVEFALNALMLSPVPLLAAMAGARWTWQEWTTYSFIASSGVEVFQGLFLPNRSPQFQDVVSNTLGILLGAFFSHLVVALLCARLGGKRSTPATPSIND